MLEAIATALIIHLGKKAIDAFWSERSSIQYAVVDQTGKLSHAASYGTRTLVRTTGTRVRYQEREIVTVHHLRPFPGRERGFKEGYLNAYLQRRVTIPNCQAAKDNEGDLWISLRIYFGSDARFKSV